MFAFGKFPNSSWSWIWMSTWGRLKPIFRTYSFDKLHWSRHFSFTGGKRRKLRSVQIMHLGHTGGAGSCNMIVFLGFFGMELQLCHSLGEVSCLDEWFMCWAAAAWWAAVRVSKAVLKTKIWLQDSFWKIFLRCIFSGISSSPGMMVPVHAGRGHLHATGPPVVLEHKFTLIQNNILAICI